MQETSSNIKMAMDEPKEDLEVIEPIDRDEEIDMKIQGR